MKATLTIVGALVCLLFATLAAGPAGAGTVVAIGVAAWMFSSRAKSTRNDADTLKAAACEAVGVPFDSNFAHSERTTVIALNSRTRRIAVSAGGESKIYGYDDVREWNVRKVSRAGGAVGYGVSGTIAAGSQNIAASMQADRETGLFLTMKDVEYPLWRVSMFDAADRARWAEILRQELDELPSQAAAR